MPSVRTQARQDNAVASSRISPPPSRCPTGYCFHQTRRCAEPSAVAGEAAAIKCHRRLSHRKALLSETGVTDAAVLGKAGHPEHSGHELVSLSGPNGGDNGQHAAAIATNHPHHPMGAAASLHRRQLKDEKVGTITIYDYFDCIERC